jgi:hypothetical protein
MELIFQVVKPEYVVGENNTIEKKMTIGTQRLLVDAKGLKRMRETLQMMERQVEVIEMYGQVFNEAREDAKQEFERDFKGNKAEETP